MPNVKFHKVKIVTPMHGTGEIFLDGVKVHGVKAVSFSVAVESFNRVTIELSAAEIEVGAVAEVDMLGDGA